MQPGRRHTEVRLHLYNHRWVTEYEEEKSVLSDILVENGLTAEIHHVGSTSVPGMIAKQIIDMLVILPDADAVREAVAVMIRAGYTFLGDGGRNGRFFLACDDSEFPYYLHVTTANNQVARDQLLFREILRNSKEIMFDYMGFKQHVAEMYPNDRSMYRIVKGYFIDAVLRAYGSGVNNSNSEGTEESVPGTAAEAAEGR